MKKIALSIIVLFLLASAALAGPPRDVLAHSAGEWTWFAHVSRTVGAVPPLTPESNEHTEVFALQNAPGQQWQPLPVLPGRAVALAGRSSQLAVLMNDGQWLTLWPDGSASGQPLPAAGRMKTLSDDGTHLWAIGSVNGGIAAANLALEHDAAATQPSTAPMPPDLSATPVPAAGEIHLSHSVPAKMVVFRETDGRWATVAEMPADAILSPDEDLSLVVVAGEPLVSFKTSSGAVRTLRYATDHIWQDVRPIENPTVDHFRVLGDGFKPLLWWTTGNSPGEFLPDVSGESPPIQLQWNGKEQLDGLPTATFAGGYLCVFGPHAGKVMEQRYKLDGTAVDAAAEVNVATDVNDTLLPRWFELVLLTSMGFSVGASVFRQWAEPAKGPVVKPPEPALLSSRLGAGVLDALPVLGALFFILIKTDVLSNDRAMPVTEALIILGSALAFYVLHTTIVELITGRSAGKWMFGLKVVTLEGTAPTKGQLLIRNLLRVIDPLIMIMISPQRQRSADAVAGTMVVPLVPLPPVEDDPFDE
jgi:uncharacterized RDD family membrane protein YckC